MIPWGAITSFFLSHPELGWVILAAWLFFELRTKRGTIYKLDKKITGSIIVIRALAKKEDAIDESKVDDYLVENGMEPADFFRGDMAATPSKRRSFEEDTEESDESPLGRSGNSPNNDERTAK